MIRFAVLVHLRACDHYSGSSSEPKMTRPAARDAMYRGRVFDAEIIELCVRWYITYRLSYRYLVAMMPERGFVLESRRDLRRYSWQVALSLSRCG